MNRIIEEKKVISVKDIINLSKDSNAGKSFSYWLKFVNGKLYYVELSWNLANKEYKFLSTYDLSEFDLKEFLSTLKYTCQAMLIDLDHLDR